MQQIHASYQKALRYEPMGTAIGLDVFVVFLPLSKILLCLFEVSGQPFCLFAVSLCLFLVILCFNVVVLVSSWLVNEPLSIFL